MWKGKEGSSFTTTNYPLLAIKEGVRSTQVPLKGIEYRPASRAEEALLVYKYHRLKLVDNMSLFPRNPGN